MNVELLKQKMKEFFDNVDPEYLISEFERMGYTFVEIKPEISKEDLEIAAEISALESGECTEGNHYMDCPCAAHEEGFIKGYNYKTSII